MLFCSPHLGKVLGSVPQWRALGPGAKSAASSAPWRDVLVTHLRRVWPFPGSLRTGTEKSTCKSLSHCREERHMGPEGKPIRT